jgi:hypothetical protein
MSEKLLDELARALAEPLPRRRAVRLLGAFVVAGALPTWARAATANGCDTLDTFCCCPQRAGAGCFRCDRPGKGKQTLCCTGACCDPSTERCGKVTNGVGSCVKCSRAERCGPTCCPSKSDCCMNLEWPASSPFRRICCKPPNRCKAGKCTCPNGQYSCNGAECCSRTKPSCQMCHEIGAAAIVSIVGTKCCPKGQTCCRNTCCKGTLVNCCGPRCCPQGTTCALSRGDDVCCPTERAIVAAGVKVCCPAGTEPTIDGCCPPGQPECCSGFDGDGNVVSCAPGVCVNGRCVSL